MKKQDEIINLPFWIAMELRTVVSVKKTVLSLNDH